MPEDLAARRSHFSYPDVIKRVSSVSADNLD